jgi:hypothetical protein
MKNFKYLPLLIGLTVTFLAFYTWLQNKLGTIAATGCFDTTKAFGWPINVYQTAGYQETCGNAYLPARLYWAGIVVDLIVYATLAYLVYLLLKKICNK